MQELSNQESNPGPFEKTDCACKGIRICKFCEKMKNKTLTIYNMVINLTGYLKTREDNGKYCVREDKARSSNIESVKYFISHFYLDCLISDEFKNYAHELKDTINLSIKKLNNEINITKNKINFTENLFEGFYVIKNFVSKEEESAILSEINSIEWKESQSGRKKQDFGPKINYKKRKIIYEGESTISLLPDKVKSLITEKLKFIKSENLGIDLVDFSVAGVGNLFYSNKFGSHIESHIDDYWVWGPRIIGMNLLSETIMTFSIDILLDGCEKLLFVIDFPLKPGDIYVMSGKARYLWKHAIKKENILADRIAVTIREYEEEYKNNVILKKLKGDKKEDI
jgi:hypothetical protein